MKLSQINSARQSWWWHFKRSIEIYKKGGDKYIGQEPNGNKYYERLLGDKLKRYVLNPRDLDIPSHPYWRAWLSYKRKDPPTEEEIKQNLDSIKRVKERAEEIFERDIDKFPKFAEKIKQIGDDREVEEKKKFPKYKDYLN